tara:strand:+ start:1645 stop:2730 length:1086 start_codon:yes stop_codon:yes gene_type:complete
MPMLENSFHINNLNDFDHVDHQRIKKLIENIQTSPNLFPYKVDIENNKIFFVEMDEKKYKKSFFVLSPGTEPGYLQGDLAFSANLSEIQNIFNNYSSKNKTAMIYNHGFCCSTLLCRLIEESFEVLSLKEPPLLHDLKSLLQINANHPLKNTIFLIHNRSYAKNQKVLVKPSDYAFDLISESEKRDIPSIYLYSPLNEYIASCIKGERIHWIKNRFMAAGPDKINNYLGSNSLNQDHSKPIIQATMYWCYFAKQFLQVSSNESNVVAINSSTLLKNPSITYQIGSHLNLQRRFNIFERRNRKKLLNTYAKTDAYLFNAADRKNLLKEVIDENQDEIKYAESLAESILEMEVKNFRFDNEII